MIIEGPLPLSGRSFGKEAVLLQTVPSPPSRPTSSPGSIPTIGKSVEQRRALWAQLESNVDATLVRHCELWEERQGAKVSISTMSRAIRKLGWRRKKRVWEPPSETKKRELLGEIG